MRQNSFISSYFVSVFSPKARPSYFADKMWTLPKYAKPACAIQSAEFLKAHIGHVKNKLLPLKCSFNCFDLSATFIPAIFLKIFVQKHCLLLWL